MFNLAAQAAAIVSRLDGEASFGTVAYIDQDDQAMRYPVKLPAAFVLLEEIDGGSGKAQGTIMAPLTWSVIVRAKQLDGPSGCLELIDTVMDLLTGFRPAEGVKPLQVGKTEYFDKQGETVAYVVRFSGQAAGKSQTMPCG